MNMIKGDLNNCIDTCLDCMKSCEICAINSLGHIELEQCVKLVLECSRICSLTAQFLARESDLYIQLCAICADMCYLCAAECDKHKGFESCAECARICSLCASMCRKIISEHSGLRLKLA